MKRSVFAKRFGDAVDEFGILRNQAARSDKSDVDVAYILAIKCKLISDKVPKEAAVPLLKAVSSAAVYRKKHLTSDQVISMIALIEEAYECHIEIED